MTEFTGRPKSEGHTPQKPKRTKAEDQELIDISQQISKNLETASFVNNRRMVEGIFGREKADELIAEAIEDGFKIRPDRFETSAARKEQIRMHGRGIDTPAEPLERRKTGPKKSVSFNIEVELPASITEERAPSIDATTSLPNIEKNIISLPRPNPFKNEEEKFQLLIKNQKTSSYKGRGG